VQADRGIEQPVERIVLLLDEQVIGHLPRREQFVFLIADDAGSAMECPRLDHFGLSVGAESELDEILARAKAWQARDDRVDIIDKHVDDHGMLAITSIYVRYLLPMMCEIQWWDYHEPRSATGTGATAGDAA